MFHRGIRQSDTIILSFNQPIVFSDENKAEIVLIYNLLLRRTNEIHNEGRDDI